MKNIWEICNFSDEIKSGNLEISKFAVELHSILDGTADKSYLDAETFLNNTYITGAIEIILNDSLQRLAKNQGRSVDLLDVSFGGGKTHSLVLLYHIFKNRDLGTKFIQENGFDSKYGIRQVPDVNVIAIDGRQIRKQTLWGEIADKLGKYDEFRKMDEERVPPKDISQIKSLFAKPTLLMLDEIPHYIVKTKSEGDAFTNATFSFLNELVSAVNSTEYTRLVITTTAEQKLLQDTSDKVKKITNLDVFGVTESVKEAVSRGANPLVPVKQKDAYGVIRKRLVKNIDLDERDRVIDEYYRYYNKNGLIEEDDYKERMRDAYPFHPFFIETLYNRVGTIQDFNKTRGMFRLLGLVLHYIDKDKTPCTLAGTGDLQLGEQPIMDDLTSKVHKDFQPIIQSDCINKAQKLDGDRNEKIVERSARTIYLYSLLGIAGRMSGIRLTDLQLAVGRPGVDIGLVEKYLHEEIENEFWFIKNRNGEFYFDSEPNINKIIEGYRREVQHDKLRDIIFGTLKSLVTPDTGIKPVIWFENELDENDNIRIFVEDYEKEMDDEKAKDRLSTILTEKPGSEIRVKQNTIVMLYADVNGIDGMKSRARTVAGIIAAESDDKIKMSKDNMKVLRSRLDASKGELETVCIQAYSKIAYPRNADVRLDQISAMETRQNSLTKMMVEKLKKQGKLMDPESELNHDIIRIDGVTTVAKILESFRVDRSKQFVLDNKQIFDAVVDGIKEGAFGYATEKEKNDDGNYIGTIGRDVDLSWDGLLIPRDLLHVREEKPDGQDEKDPSDVKEPDLRSSFRYELQLHDTENALKALDHIGILGMNATIDRKDLNITMHMDDTSITIVSRLEKSSEIKSLLKSLESKGYDGEGKLTINSGVDLQKEFNKQDVEFKTV